MANRARSIEQEDQSQWYLPFAIEAGDVLKDVVFVELKVFLRQIVDLIARGVGDRGYDGYKISLELYWFFFLRWIARAAWASFVTRRRGRSCLRRLGFGLIFSDPQIGLGFGLAFG